MIAPRRLTDLGSAGLPACGRCTTSRNRSVCATFRYSISKGRSPPLNSVKFPASIIRRHVGVLFKITLNEQSVVHTALPPLSADQVAGANHTKTLLQVRQPAPHSCHPSQVDDHIAYQLSIRQLEIGNLPVHLRRDNPTGLTSGHHIRLQSDTALWSLPRVSTALPFQVEPQWVLRARKMILIPCCLRS
jgi:hypothetical protein